MELHLTPTSPYGRMPRIVIIERGLERRVKIVEAKTRREDSPYYAVNPSGRVPYLRLDDGMGFEESQLICAYLDNLDGSPQYEHPTGDARWNSWRLESLARSLLDGMSVWIREIKRPLTEQSPTIIAHEMQRSRRLIELWEKEIEDPMMQGPLTMAQITLICALDYDHRLPGAKWRHAYPRLNAWAEKLGERRSIAETFPPL